MALQYICNKCGKTFDRWDAQEQFHISADLGYGTKYDGLILDLDLCCSCMDDLIADCKINPIIEE